MKSFSDGGEGWEIGPILVVTTVAECCALMGASFPMTTGCEKFVEIGSSQHTSCSGISRLLKRKEKSKIFCV
jgi:hypothetical protein